MDSAITLFGNLVLTFLGFVIPVVSALLSISRRGIAILTNQYENERKQAEENLSKLTTKRIDDQEKGIDTKEILKNVSTLEKIEKDAEKKLGYLKKPLKQVLKLFIFFGLSFLATDASLLWQVKIDLKGLSLNSQPSLFVIGLLLFLLGIFFLLDLLKVVTPVLQATEEEKSKNERDDKQVMMSILERVDKGTANFLKNVYIKINKEKVNTTFEIVAKVQEKKDLEISFFNAENKMAKNIEIGLVFPTDFLIEKKNAYAIYTSTDKQIVRFTSDNVQGETDFFFELLPITPLKNGSFPIKTFIKAENIETIRRTITIRVN